MKLSALLEWARELFQIHKTVAQILQTVIQIRKELTMADINAALQSLKDEVAKNTTIEKSALALIQGFDKRLTDAAEAAKKAGATDEQLQEITDLSAALKANDSELSDAVQANTPTVDAIV